MQTVRDIPGSGTLIPVTDGAQIAERIREVRRGSRGFITNFFAGHKQIDAWTRRGDLSLMQGERCLWIRRRDCDFAHLYFFAADSQAIENSLASIVAVSDDTSLAIDLVGRQDDTGLLAEVFRRHGFADQAILVRMSLAVGESLAGNSMASDVTPALPEDAPALVALLERQFDRYSKQLPDEQEVLEAIDAGNILIVRHNMAIVGLLFFEITGAAATLRYWCVDEAFRGQGVGAKLIRSMFHLCRSCRSIVLWVYAENTNAIVRYRHYGFRETDTVDRILLRR